MRHCKNCLKDNPGRARGLCWKCHLDPSIRTKFPTTHKCARRGVGQRGDVLPVPTDARPGTEAKVRVLEERARLGQALWHPLDNRTAPHASELLDPPALPRLRSRLEVRPARVLIGGGA